MQTKSQKRRLVMDAKVEKKKEKKEKKKGGGFARFINGVEKVGNKLPHPFFLFVYLCIIVAVLSIIFAGSQVTYTAANSDGTTTEVVSEVVNLVSPTYIQSILKDWVKIYVNFSPLGLVMVMMLAIGFAQETGVFDSVMRKTLLGAPAAIVTFVLATGSPISFALCSLPPIA